MIHTRVVTLRYTSIFNLLNHSVLSQTSSFLIIMQVAWNLVLSVPERPLG